ncbi:IPT/TIG domain-containing protein [Tepidibacter mesophilus]|uniref:IPT/TIG domain-containing protein n=1 Tax=Tepidibacter mesophilus TaxID=655607 RepID=UPI000C071CCB|nr:IPT/TIG domain-containing protein [Tepidibacter mesophilus]
MKRISWIKRVTSFILVFMMAFGMIPWSDISSYAYDESRYYVDQITITKIYEDGGYSVKQTKVTVEGAYLQGASVGTMTITGYNEFTNRTMNSDSVLEFIVDGNIVGDAIRVGSTKIDIDMITIPALSNIDKRNVIAGEEKLVLTGPNLKKLIDEPDKYKAFYSNVAQANGKIALSLIEKDAVKQEYETTTNLTGVAGLQNIVITKEETKAGLAFPSGNKDVKLTIQNTYLEQFRLINKIQPDTLDMNPNRGKAGEGSEIGDEILFTAKTGLDRYDVFFLKDLTDKFTNDKKGVNTDFIPNVDGKQVLKTNIPYKKPGIIEPGEYFVVITNEIPPGKDPNNEVTMQYVLPEKFTIIEADQKMKIINIAPNSGPDTGINAEISGLFFGTLNIPDLNPNAGSNSGIDVKKPIAGSSDEVMDISYPDYVDGKYKGKDIATVERQVKVIIGDVAKFARKPSDNTSYDYSFSNVLDRIQIITPQVSDAEKNPVKDVIVETVTTITLKSGDKVTLKDRSELKNGFTYNASKITPRIDKVIPEKIQVTKENNTKYTLSEDRLISIEGENFLINKYTKPDGTEEVRYPIIELGNDIRLNKNSTGTKSNPDLYLKIFDKSGNELDGSKGNEVGSKIIVIIPKHYNYKNIDKDGTVISEGEEDTFTTNIGKTHVKVINPIRNSSEEGLSDKKFDAVEFVDVNDDPVVKSVTPNIVTVAGGEEIKIEGSNFKDGVKVFIDGVEVKTIKREGDGQKITFTAPKGREGTTQIQVMNPSGAIAIADFTYVKTYTEPKLTSFSPNKGSNGILVVVNGDNFLKPDPSTTDTSGANIFKLTGTRILLSGRDINDYYKDSNNKISLQDFKSKDEKIIKPTQDDLVEVGSYYQSVLLQEKDKANSFYTIDTNTKGEVTLSNGKDESYTITKPVTPGSTTEFYALSGKGVQYKVELSSDVDKDILTIKYASNNSVKTELYTKTPYVIDDGKIVGHRVKVISKNEIHFIVPILDVEKWYDLTVKNPDTKSDTKRGEQGFYYFKTPKKNPTITKIVPNQGSVEGGYTIDIYGSDFEANGDIKSRVFIGGVEVLGDDIIVNTGKTKMTIVVPKYPGDLKQEIEGDRKSVPVVVLNSDGGNAKEEKGFTYVIPTSNPKITKILPDSGNAAGGENVQIWGSDFRYFEPYVDTNGDAEYDAGEKYQDLNNNGQWDNLEDQSVYDTLKQEYEELLKDPNVSDDEKAKKDYRNILPKVYFGKEIAEIIDFSDGYISVKTPVGQSQSVDVQVVNNDYGTSNKFKFNYKSSSPQITSIIPNVGKKQGRDNVEIHGKEFSNSTIKVVDSNDSTKIEDKNMPLVRFGDINDKNISNITINPGELNAGTIVGSKGNTNVGNLTVEYNANDSNNKVLSLTIKEEDKEYKTVITNYDDETIYVPVELLEHTDTDGGKEKYAKYELVKISIDTYERRIIVERGYSPQTNLLNSGQVEVKTPSYYTIGQVPITIINPDKGEASGTFEYKNPDSIPAITEITRDGQPSVLDTTSYGKDVKVVKVNYKGGSIISVIGSDFRENAKISIGNIMEIPYANMTPNLPSKLTFKIDAVDESEVGKLHKVVVQNEDGAFASSDESTIPIYIVFTKGETTPKIDKITPNKGLSKGGEKVVIKGLDFRETMEGYEPKKIAVYFGEIRVPDKDITFIDYKTIEVITPKHDPKTVDVKIENPDGEISNSVEYTYLSDPNITQIVDAKDNSINISTIYVDGGQEIQIKGNDFMSGARVVFSPVLKEATDSDTDTITIDGKNYVLVSGTDGSAEFMDSQNLKVTTPAGKLGSKGVMIINPDKAGSNIYDIVYIIDQIDAPTGVKAELIYDKYIKIDWNEVKDATSYEIYAVEDDKEMYLVGTTDLTTFIYRDVKSKTDYRFIIKAIGEFGLSKGSSKSNEVTTKSGSGYEDKDGEINEKTVVNRSGDTVNVLIGTDDYDEKETIIDLTKGEYAGAKEVVISIPARVATSYLAKDIKVVLSDMYVKFNPTAFNVSKLYESKDKDKSGVKFKIGINQKNDTTSLSNEYELKADVFIGADITSIDYLKNNMEISLDYDSSKADLRRMRNISLRRYDEYKNEWTYVKQRMDNYSTSINSPVNRLGRYSIIGSRR